MFSPNDTKKIFDMEPDEAYEDYLAFCKENDMKAASKEDFFTFNRLIDEEMQPE